MFFDRINISPALACGILGLLLTACPSDSNPVLSKAKLQVQPTELDFGESETQLGFTIKNVGQQNLTWTISEDVDWITNFQSTSGKIDGGGQAQITVKIDRTKLDNGNNSRKIQVTAQGDDGGQLEGGSIDVTVKATRTSPPQVSMARNDLTEIGATTAKASALVDALGSANITQYGHVWSSARNPDINDGDDSKSTLGEKTTTGRFQTPLTNLQNNTTYYIRAYATNTQGTTYSGEVTFQTSNNSPPTGLSLTNATIKENIAAKTTIGTFTTTDPDVGDTHIYSLVSGAGSTGNSSFLINGDTLKNATVFDYETKSSYTIRIRTTDKGDTYFERSFVINITDEADGSSGASIILTNAEVRENEARNKVVGTLSTIGAGARYVYKLVSGAGSTDNSSFVILNNELRTNAVFDFETKNSYSIRVKSTNLTDATTAEQVFKIKILDVNQPPTNITLSQAFIAENNSVDAVIGTLSTTDPDASDSHTYTLVSGGDDFNISGNNLRASKSFDYESKKTYTIRIEVNDGNGGKFQRDLTITISDDETDGKLTMTYNGKTYKAVKIGTQWWLAENLNEASHTDGNSSCYGNESGNCNTYGRLYDWYAAVNIASKIPGWHLATDAEWTTLTTYLGSNAGTKIKQGGSSGFNALLAGNSGGPRLFSHLSNGGYFWSASPHGSSQSWYRRLSTGITGVVRDDDGRTVRMSVRLVKDKD